MRLAAWLLCCAATPVFASPARAGRHGCLGCHTAASKLVGSAYQDMAAPYSGDENAAAMLVHSIGIGNGGSGGSGGGSRKWIDVSVPPQKAGAGGRGQAVGGLDHGRRKMTPRRPAEDFPL